MKIYFCCYLKNVNMKLKCHLTDLFFHVLTLQAFLLLPLRPKYFTDFLSKSDRLQLVFRISIRIFQKGNESNFLIKAIFNLKVGYC